MNRNVLSLSLLLGAGNANAGVLDDAAARHGAKIVWVDEGTPLYTAASTLYRNADKSAVEDRYIEGYELIWTTLCEDRVLLKNISRLTNDVADLTAIVGDEAGMPELSRAMRLDNVMVKLKEGTTCEVYPEFKTFYQIDGIRGDGADKLRAYNGLYPIAVPNEFFNVTPSPSRPSVPAVPTPAPVVPAPVAPEVPSAPVVSSEIDLLRPYIILDGHIINENGKAPLNGYGVGLEGLAEAGPIVFRLADSQFNALTYEQSINDRVNVASFDTGLGYLVRLGDKTGLVLGLNGRGRFAGIEYAGSEANTSDWSLGPELDLVVRAGKVDLTGRASTSLVGRVNTNVDVPNYRPTSDSMSRSDVSLEAGYDFGAVRLAGEVGVSDMNYNVRTQDGALLPKGSTAYDLGIKAQVDLTENIFLQGGFNILPYVSDYGQNTNSKVGSAGIGASF